MKERNNENQTKQMVSRLYFQIRLLLLRLRFRLRFRINSVITNIHIIKLKSGIERLTDTTNMCICIKILTAFLKLNWFIVDLTLSLPIGELSLKVRSCNWER